SPTPGYRGSIAIGTKYGTGTRNASTDLDDRRPPLQPLPNCVTPNACAPSAPLAFSTTRSLRCPARLAASRELPLPYHHHQVCHSWRSHHHRHTVPLGAIHRKSS